MKPQYEVKVGDKVKGVKFREKDYKYLGFDEAMEDYIGVTGVVAQIDSVGYAEVEFEEESYWYPAELLSKED